MSPMDPLAMAECDNLPETNLSTSEKAIRRTRSFQSLRYEWLSSEETLGSEKYSDSIYDAEPVFSTENLPEFISPISGEGTDDVTSPVPVLSPSLSPRTPITLRASRSAPRLRDSPEKHATLVHPKASDRSLHPVVRADTIISGLPEASFYQARSLSLNNLDVMLNQMISLAPEPHSSSTSDGGVDITQLPQYPLKPSLSPPYRSPTPPGLPSFGSPEAQTFRLTPDQPRSLWSRVWGSPTAVVADPAQSTTSMISPSMDSDSPSLTPQVDLSSPSSEGFRRTLAMIGMSRIVTPPAKASQSPRASLPPGITISTTPGPLAQAEDSTFIRGRFHPRVSGHGIGFRALESHPLVRRSQSDHGSVIEEQVRAIDKACSRADREALHEARSVSSSGRPRGMAQRRSGTGSSGIAPMTMSYRLDMDGGSIQDSTRSGPRLASILEDHREQSMLQVGNEKPKQRRMNWRKICIAMGCCRDFWIWWCCGCGLEPTDVHAGGVPVNPERTLLYR